MQAPAATRYAHAMQTVKVTHIDDRTLIAGSDRRAVEAAVAQQVQSGAQLLEAIGPLGNNWVATVRRPKPPEDVWCEVTRIGLQRVIEGASEAVVRERVGELSTHGAALVAGPEFVDGRWVAVVDERASQPNRPRG